MKQFTRELHVQTRGKGLYELTREAESWANGLHLTTGLLTLFIQHTTASLTIQENADPDVIRDLNEFFGRLVKENETWYRHMAEGPDDMTSHIRAALTQTQISVPLHEGRLALGTWQGVYVFEHRAAPHRRSVVLHMVGE
ncbi:MAG: secondary thiamine-phosphate synthase enzyme YjbQ [Acidobacteriota bacterium]|nr:secondary thiamine-phosphate synthase enzyme YjbQ [Acidobacteriota bacterium]